jgi:transposase
LALFSVKPLSLKVQKGHRTGKAQVGFNFIQRLFVLERQWANLSTEQRLEQRQLTAQPLIDDLAQWIEKSLPLITPKSQLGRAMIYLHKQLDKLTVFLQSGNVPIHNNQAENKIRPFVIDDPEVGGTDSQPSGNFSLRLHLK